MDDKPPGWGCWRYDPAGLVSCYQPGEVPRWVTEISFNGFTRLNFSRTSSGGMLIESVARASAPAGSWSVSLRVPSGGGTPPEPTAGTAALRAPCAGVRTSQIRASAEIG
ncbi:MAG TPA: hypothetical protein VG077_15680 [Verrucomicrobiae bacterium]|nr:hypothetical protein [Verrucomicrobiae bacterium]